MTLAVSSNLVSSPYADKNLIHFTPAPNIVLSNSHSRKTNSKERPNDQLRIQEMTQNAASVMAKRKASHNINMGRLNERLGYIKSSMTDMSTNASKLRQKRRSELPVEVQSP